MLPDRVLNPGPLTYESGALPIALRGPAWEQKKQIQFRMYKKHACKEKQWFLANSVCHFAALKAKIFVSGCHGNYVCWKKNMVEYFDNVATLTYSESIMKIWDHECPAPFKFFSFLSCIALNNIIIRLTT